MAYFKRAEFWHRTGYYVSTIGKPHEYFDLTTNADNFGWGSIFVVTQQVGSHRPIVSVTFSI